MARHPLSQDFRQLFLKYLDSLHKLIEKHEKYHDLFWKRDSDLLTEADIEQHANIFDHYFLTGSERYYITQVISRYGYQLRFAELINT
jgi:hypothetical protein